MADFQISRGEVDFGGASDRATLTFDTPLADASTAIVVPSSTTQQLPSGGAIPTGTALTPRDRNCLIGRIGIFQVLQVLRGVLTDVAADRRVRYEAWEYTGAPGGANEFKINGEYNIGVNNPSQAIAASGILPDQSAVSKTVPLRLTVRDLQNDPLVAGALSPAFMWTVDYVNFFGGIRTWCQRETSGGLGPVTIGVCNAAFVGSNWTVQKVEYAFTNPNNDETITLPQPVTSWDNSFIVVTFRRQGIVDGEERACVVSPGSDTSTLKAKVRGSLNGARAIIYVVENPEITVKHFGSEVDGRGNLIGTSEPVSPSILTETFTTGSDLSTLAHFVNSAHSGSAAAVDRSTWVSRLNSTSEMEFWRNAAAAQPATGLFWAAQVIDFAPEAEILPITASEDLLLTSFAPTISLESILASVDLTLESDALAKLVKQIREWTVNANAPTRTDKYEWRLPQNTKTAIEASEDQHIEQTVAPGDLLIKPSQIDVVPTKSPKESGIQHGQEPWEVEEVPSSRGAWYLLSSLVASSAFKIITDATRLASYDWRLPNNENQHSEQTTAPGDLLIKPSKLGVVPTKAPKKSGIQHGASSWELRDEASDRDEWDIGEGEDC